MLKKVYRLWCKIHQTSFAIFASDFFPPPPPSREKLKLKEREEAWVKIENLAKSNPQVFRKD